MGSSSSQVFELPAIPPVGPAFARAAWSATRSARSAVEIPEWRARVPRLHFDRRHVADYRGVCGYADGDTLPMLYPQALATPVFLHLMTRPGFPLPLMGLVHVRNAVEQRRALALDDRPDLEVRIAGSRTARAGLEVDIALTLSDDRGEILWQATMTILHRRAGRDGGRSAPPAETIPMSHYLHFTAPADVGRRYARVSRDYNPIHLSAATARLFGFPRAIAHGLWTAARVLALLEAPLGAPPARYDVQFRQPLLLPGAAALRFQQGSGRIDFSVLAARGGRTHLTGTLR